MQAKKRLGEMLVESNLLSQEQLANALVEHKKAGLKLGQFLDRRGIIAGNLIVDILSRQLKIEKYDPSKFTLDVTLSKLISADDAVQYQLAPLIKKGRLLIVAMTDPMDITALDHIEVITGLEVEPVVCTEKEVNHLTTTIYGVHSGIKDILESIEISPCIETDAVSEPDNKTDVQVSVTPGSEDDSLGIRLVNAILFQAFNEGASDIHISPQQNDVRVRFRVDGKLHDVSPPPKSLFLKIVARMKIMADMDITISRIPQDGRFTMRANCKEINVRVSSMPTIFGEKLVLRLLDMTRGVYTLDRLGMAAEDRKIITEMIHKPNGLILSTGPTGSGKTTALYAILSELDQSECNIITLEDPVEYRIPTMHQIQLNRKAGMTFATGLRAILRQDPEVIMVGEIRDQETAEIAVQAAETGHRVLSTMHTNDAASAITRLMDMGIEPFIISSVLLLSFSQRLVRTVCTYCGEPYRPPKKALIAWGLDGLPNANFRRGRGCDHCMNTGYKDRTGIFEVMRIDETIQDMIMERASASEITKAAVSAGKFRTLQDDASNKVLQGITTLEEAATAVKVITDSPLRKYYSAAPGYDQGNQLTVSQVNAGRLTRQNYIDDSKASITKIVEWNEGLSVGVNVIDNAHKYFIGYYNELFAALSLSMGSSVVQKSLIKLIKYAKYHFHREEVLMEKEGYPGLAAIKNEHESILRTTLEFQERTTSNSIGDVSKEALVFLCNRLVTHMIEGDGAFAKYVQKKHE